MSADRPSPEEFLRGLTPTAELSAADIAELEKMASGAAPVDLPAKLRDSGTSTQQLTQKENLNEKEVTDLRAQIAEMSIPQRVKLAMFGNSTCRGLLILDANPLIHLTVLSNPQLQEGEVETFAKNPNVSEMVLREISKNRTWVKSYTVKLNLVMNPKTPTDLSIKWLRFLNKNDMRKVARSKNIPQQVAINARKQLADSEQRK